MIANDTTAVILAAGLGTRMKSKRPKVLHELAGRPMVLHLVATLRSLGVERIVGVVGEGMEALAEALSPYPCVVQRDRLGTAHAVLAARERLEGLSGTLLALYGDTPLIPAETVRAIMNARNGPADPGVVVLGFRPENPGDYGRLATDETGALRRIVEAGDASASELEIGLCNSGVMAIDAARAPSWLAEVDNDNAGGEYYLTDLVAIARSHGRRPVVVEGAAEDLIGINSRVELAEAEGVLQNRLRRRAMENGATLRDPASVHFSFDTVIGADVLVEPHVVFGPGVTVESGSRIRAYSYLENCRVGADVAVGPFARLRPGTRVGASARVGNFVEIKNADVEPGAKVNHLSYIGDARVGAGANIGAGTITCNYDGYNKWKTDIGAGAFIGSNTALVAPVTVGDGAVVGAGSVIAENVDSSALAVARGRQVTTEGGARVLNARNAAKRTRENNNDG